MPQLLLILIAALMVSGVAPVLACSGKLGVSRTITIDTTGGPLYGNLQYKTESLLEDGEVIITFDDGPLSTNTRKVLAALRDHCTKATFFMVGRMAVANPGIVREVANEGHTIASHTWSHKNLKRMGANDGKGEIELGISTIQHALGKPIAPFFRFPYLADSKALIEYSQQRNIAVFSIDVDAYDYRTRSGDSVRRAVLRQLKSRKKGIILLHDIQISVVRGIQPLLDELHDRGYKVVHLQAATGVETIEAFDQQAEELHKNRRYAQSIRPVRGGGQKTAPNTKTDRNANVLAQTDSPAPKPASRSDWMGQVFKNQMLEN